MGYAGVSEWLDMFSAYKVLFDIFVSLICNNRLIWSIFAIEQDRSQRTARVV